MRLTKGYFFGSLQIERNRSDCRRSVEGGERHGPGHDATTENGRTTSGSPDVSSQYLCGSNWEFSSTRQRQQSGGTTIDAKGAPIRRFLLRRYGAWNYSARLGRSGLVLRLFSGPEAIKLFPTHLSTGCKEPTQEAGVKSRGTLTDDYGYIQALIYASANGA